MVAPPARYPPSMRCALILVLAGCGGSPPEMVPDDASAPDLTPTCTADETLCGKHCVNVASNIDNCGQCDLQCEAHATCQKGRCTCNAGLLLCNGTCIDPVTDSRYCGGCDGDCSPAQNCVQG